MAAVLDREALLADRSLVGAVFCRAYSRRVDEWLADIFASVADGRDGVALAAVGGYGRSELSPGSDIDVMLVHDRGADVEALANELWYPIWDEGLKLGHSVRTAREALALAATDLETATSLLSLRSIAGDDSLVIGLHDAARVEWSRRSKKWLPLLRERTLARHVADGELAFLLEPDLKSSRGGLRDGHVLEWLHLAETGVEEVDRMAMAPAYDTLLATRVELHRSTGRVSNVLLLEEQDGLADRLGHADADALMAEIAAAGRLISWSGDEAWRTATASRRRWFGRAGREVGAGLHAVDEAVELGDDADLTDPLLTLRVAEAAARLHLALPRATLERLGELPSLPAPWPPEARALFERLLLNGHDAIGVLESLDHFGLFSGLIPEWEPVRSRPQRNAYHRFTVDRHLFEAAAQAARLTDRTDDPGLLVVAALLHDIGKGYPGDHTEVGLEMIPTIAARMGYDAVEAGLIADVCRHHLLLPDVATRRDLNDPDTIRAVADAVGSVRLLDLLDAHTEADSIATGPAAWSRWKAGLVADLVRRVRVQIESGGDRFLDATFPTADQRQLMQQGERRVVVDQSLITVVMPDAHSSLWRVAGTLALHGLDVLQADVHSDSGMALEVYRVEPVFGSVDPEALAGDVWRAVDGQLAIFARLDERVRIYEAGRRRPDPQPVVGRRGTRVSFDNEISTTATVVEVSATDSLGLLCRVAHALSEQGLDITSSKVQTLGDQAVDSFYVRDLHGAKITDTAHLDEIRRGVLHSLDHGAEPA